MLQKLDTPNIHMPIICNMFVTGLSMQTSSALEHFFPYQKHNSITLVGKELLTQSGKNSTLVITNRT